MTDAMQITVSSEIENRMEDSNSTDARRVREPQLTFMPSVETVIRGIQTCGLWCGVEIRPSKKKADFLQKEPP